jgi:glyoxylase-like metal-dependent hydrolase (beta-lactamase superfamily II)/rhodanese-related sulfurtransferase
MPDTPQDDAVSAVPTVEIGELLPRLDRGDRLLLLDVRNDEEYGAWKLEARSPVPTMHVPYFEFVEDPDGSIARVPRDREVVVLCAQGGSSEMIAGMLGEAGIPSRNVRGGMVAYGGHLEAVAVPLAAEEARRFELWQVNRRGKACLSYVVASGGEAVIVDPSRHGEWYETFAAGRGARIVRVLDTHVHADHVSGGPSLATRLDVPYSVRAGPGFELRHGVTPLDDGSRISLGGRRGVELEVRTLYTPGHTPGSTSYLVDGKYVLTGDTLFVSSVGRPDLGGHVGEWGRALFHTLKTRLAVLPDETVVLPAHYGNVREVADGGVVWERLGRLRTSVPELQIDNPEGFVEAMRKAVRDPPPTYAEIVKVNLGLTTPSDQTIEEWELGKNQCAAAVAPRG